MPSTSSPKKQIPRNLCGFLLAFFCLLTAAEAAEKSLPPIPDLTKGGELTRHNAFLVGPAGVNCWIWRARQREKGMLDQKKTDTSLQQHLPFNRNPFNRKPH